MQKALYSTEDAAKHVGRCRSRIRQICREQNIGQRYGIVRLLTERDVKAIAKWVDVHGKRRCDSPEPEPLKL